MTIVLDAPDIRSVCDKIDQIRAAADAAVAAHRTMIRDSLAALRDAGVDALLITCWIPRGVDVGSEIGVLETYQHDSYYKVTRHEFSIHRGGPRYDIDDESLRAGSYRLRGELTVSLHIKRGRYRIVAVHDRDVLVAKLPAADTETSHRKSISRLRGLARREGLRLRVRDREVAILDPFGEVIHEGNALTAFAFILNFDLAMGIGQFEPATGAPSVG